jgi:uncharacterized membrane protein
MRGRNTPNVSIYKTHEEFSTFFLQLIFVLLARANRDERKCNKQEGQVTLNGLNRTGLREVQRWTRALLALARGYRWKLEGRVMKLFLVINLVSILVIKSHRAFSLVVLS